jgi:hypothetical protein
LRENDTCKTYNVLFKNFLMSKTFSFALCNAELFSKVLVKYSYSETVPAAEDIPYDVKIMTEVILGRPQILTILQCVC